MIDDENFRLDIPFAKEYTQLRLGSSRGAQRKNIRIIGDASGLSSYH